MSRHDQPVIYRLRVDGHIDEGRIEALGDLSVVHEQEGVTTLMGPMADQSALYGLIVRLRDMGLDLLDVERISPGTETNVS